MKRLLIAAIIIAGATRLFCALRNETALAVQTLATRRAEWRAQIQRLEQLRIEHEGLRGKVRNARRQAAMDAADVATNDLAEEFAANGLHVMSPEMAERLLAELGFNWNSPGDYLIVSKTSLSSISLAAIDTLKLTDAVRAALAITPGEQAAIEAEAQLLNSEYVSWLQMHVKREEPSGNVLAKYLLEPDTQFSQNALDSFTSLVYSTLGAERGDLFHLYAWNWMNSLGMFSANGAYGETSMTVRRDSGYLTLELREPMGNISCRITPGQPFPEAFHSLFPGGWTDLAAQEGFALPIEFQKK